MVGSHHRLHDLESEKTLGDSEEQGSLACFLHGTAELDMTEQLNSNAYLPLMNLIEMFFLCK